MKNIFLTIGVFLLLGVGVSRAYDEPWPAIKANDYPAAEKLIRGRLQEDPGHVESRFLLARILAWQKRYEEALAEYKVLLAHSPGHTDYLLGQGQTLFWQGSLDAALVAVSQAIEGRSDYVDLWILKVKILLAQGNSRQAHELAALAERRFGEERLQEIHRLLASASPPVLSFKAHSEVEAGFSYEYLSDDFDQWVSSYVIGEWSYEPRATLYAQARLTDRFGKDDQELTVGTFQPLSSLYTYQLETSLSPSYDVLAHYSFMGALSRTISQEWDVTVSGRHSIYSATHSNLLSLTGGHYFNSQRLAYTIYLSKVEAAATTYSHRLQWSRYYDRRNYVGFYVATGKETENVGEMAGRSSFITTSVFSYGILGRHWLDDGPYAIIYQLWQHNQGDIYTRWGGALGFRIQF